MGVEALFPDIPDLYITGELARRAAADPDWRGEAIAVQELAALMASDPDR